MFKNRFSSSLIQAITAAAGLTVVNIGTYTGNNNNNTYNNKRKQWLINRDKTIYERKIAAHEWNKKNYYGKILTRTGRPMA